MHLTEGAQAVLGLVAQALLLLELGPPLAVVPCAWPLALPVMTLVLIRLMTMSLKATPQCKWPFGQSHASQLVHQEKGVQA